MLQASTMKPIHQVALFAGARIAVDVVQRIAAGNSIWPETASSFWQHAADVGQAINQVLLLTIYLREASGWYVWPT